MEQKTSITKTLCIILFDIEKAYLTSSHQILEALLERLGFPGKARKLIVGLQVGRLIECVFREGVQER